jgi:EpsI family protein
MNQQVARFWVLAVLLSATLALSRNLEHAAPDILARPLDSIPLQIEDWRGSPLPPLSDDIEASLGATSYPSEKLTLLVTYYAEQRTGKWMHSPKDCFPGTGWSGWDFRKVAVPFSGSPAATVNLYSVQKLGERAHVLYWYQSRSGVFANEDVRKAYLLLDALHDNRAGAALVRLVVPDGPLNVKAEAEFAAILIPEMQLCLMKY